MTPVDYAPVLGLSLLWRLSGLTPIARFHQAGANDQLRGTLTSSAVKAQGGTWVAWVGTAVHFSATEANRPALLWPVVGGFLCFAVSIVVLFLVHTCRGEGAKPSLMFLGAPLISSLPSASNFLLIVGITADIALFLLRAGFLT